MTPGEVDKFAVQLCGRKRHDRTRRVDGHCPQRPVQSHGGILKDVVGVFPAANAGIAAQHPVGQGMKAAGDHFNDGITGGKIARAQPL